MADLTREELDRLEELLGSCGGETEWMQHSSVLQFGDGGIDLYRIPYGVAKAHAIAALHNAAPALIAKARRLEALAKALAEAAMSDSVTTSQVIAAVFNRADQIEKERANG